MIFFFYLSINLATLIAEASGSSFSLQKPFSYSSHLEEHVQDHTCPNVNVFLHFNDLKENPLYIPSIQNSSTSQSPTNSTTNPNPQHPWSSAPQCLTNYNITYCHYTSTPFCDSEYEDATYCIYTSSSFASNRGLTLLTTPSTASLIANSPGFLHPLKPYPPPSHTSYYSASIPGKGRGIIANTTFKPGDLIQATTPVLILDESTTDVLPNQERFRFQSKAVATLPTGSKRLFYGLSGVFGGDGVEDRVLTNAFSASFASEGRWGVIAPEAASLNHVCRPNARFAFDPETLTHKIHATRTIYPGEELTVSYIDEKSPYSDRQMHISKHWGFNCSCTHCSLPASQRSQSDLRITTLTSLRMELLDFKSEATPEMALELVKLYEEEELHGVMAEAYMIAALRFAMYGDEERTREYAGAAVERWFVWEKSGLRNREEMRVIEREPRKAWCWGLAEKRKTKL